MQATFLHLRGTLREITKNAFPDMTRNPAKAVRSTDKVWSQDKGFITSYHLRLLQAINRLSTGSKAVWEPVKGLWMVFGWLLEAGEGRAMN